MEMIPAKHIVIKTKSPAGWFGVNESMNIYRGCSHGCIYCDSRSDCYQNPNFDTVKVKEDALRVIHDDLQRKKVKGIVGTGAMSDPYNPVEKHLRLTRQALELLNRFRFGVAIDTKSPLVTRDVDVLRAIMAHSPVIVKMTVTTADDDLCRQLEPYVAATSERFAALKTLSDSGIFCGVLMMPILPFINDSEENIVGILQQAKAAGAKFVYPAMGMTLRSGNREYYYQKLEERFPGLKQQYIQVYGNRYNCSSLHAKKLWSVFLSTCNELGLLYNMTDIITAYQSGYRTEQLSLFGDELEW